MSTENAIIVEVASTITNKALDERILDLIKAFNKIVINKLEDVGV